MAIESRNELWRRLFGTDEGTEQRLPGDLARLAAFAWLGARVGPTIAPWVDLPALSPDDPASEERGPPCRACGRVLVRREPLRGCTVCLVIEHRACHEARGRCACR